MGKKTKLEVITNQAINRELGRDTVGETKGGRGLTNDTDDHQGASGDDTSNRSNGTVCQGTQKTRAIGPSDVDHEETRRFLEAVFGGKPEESYILVWSLTTKLSQWFQDLDEAAEFIKKNNTNAYVGTGLSADDRGPRQRCPANKTIGIPGLYCDIDIKGDAHKKALLPSTLDEALGLVKSIGFNPTMTVHSGNGIQCWWLFHEMCIFDGKKHREQIASLSKRLGHVLRRAGEKKGWKIDSVYDLARVLRPPGTWNLKKDCERKPARLIEINTSRYFPLDFEEGLPSLEELGAADGEIFRIGNKKVFADVANDVVVGEVTLSQLATPPRELLKIMLECDPKFNATWNNEREDLPSKSEYHQSLANYAANMGWTEQQIANLLITWNRTHHINDMEKVMRPKYMADTIAKAVGAAKKMNAARNIERQEAIEGTAFEEEDADPRDEIRKNLRDLLGVDVLSVKKYVGSEPIYHLEINIPASDVSAGGKRTVEIGNIDSFESKTKVIRKIKAQTNQPIVVSKKEWQQVSYGLFRLIDEVESDDSRFDDLAISQLIVSYLDGKARLTAADTERSKLPFFHVDGFWYIRMMSFKKWCAIHGEQYSRNVLPVLFKQVGCENKTVSYNPTAKNRPAQTSVTVWRIPHHLAE